MSKYGTSKYGTHKYGRYEIEVSGDQPLSQITKYRLRTIDSHKRESRPITNQSVTFPTNEPVHVRIKSNDGPWVTMQSMDLPGDTMRVRVKSVSSDNESQWVESVVGTVK